MGYITSKELSAKWGIGQCRIIKLAREGRIEGAHIYGKTWVFPENAVKPADGRTKVQKNRSANASDAVEGSMFRYPIFGFRDISGFVPPLTDEEQKLNNAVLAYHACRFDEAEKMIGDLPETAVNRYCRIGALYVGCMIDTALCNPQRFFNRYGRLSAEMQQDFPRKAEMSYLLRELDVSLGSDVYFKDSFLINYDYKYHESFLPHLTALCAVSLSYSDKSGISDEAMMSHEANCLLLENSGHYFDLQVLHLYLAVTYSYMKNQSMAALHLRKVFELAEKYELYYCPASEYFYMKEMLDSVLSEFSETFQTRLRNIGEELHERFMRFINAASINSFYKMLPGRDYLYAFYAVHGYTNKEIADLMNKKPSAVGMRFSSIYSALGIKSKKELIQLYESATGNSLLSS